MCMFVNIMFDHKFLGGKNLCYDQLYDHNNNEFISVMCESAMFNFVEYLFQTLHVVLTLVATVFWQYRKYFMIFSTVS